MKNITKILTVGLALPAMAMLGGCNDNDENYIIKYPHTFDISKLPEVGDIHTYKAPLYWSIYEYCYELDKQSVAHEKIQYTTQQWEDLCLWMEDKFKPYGYDMVCTDGFIKMLAKDGSPFMNYYGETSLAEIVEIAKRHGLRVGVYDNPMWMHCEPETLIPGTNIPVGSLLYDKTKDKVLNPKVKSDKWGYQWLLATHEGAQEWIDAFFKHYKDLGVDYIRIDFLSWYEDGIARTSGELSSRGYGRENYGLSLAYIAQAAKKYGIFTSLVMPHMYNDGELERKYGNMTRIVGDTFDGGWVHTSSWSRGQSWSSWPNCNNQYDGFTYWNHITGKGKIIPDGDFIRLNKYNTDAEKEFVISLQLIAGGPVTIADQPTTIKQGDEKFYTNAELLALNADGFVGRPVDDYINSSGSTMWYGQMSDGDYIVGIFNRDDVSKPVNIPLSTFGIEGPMKSRDLWLHEDEGEITSIAATVAAHGCKILRLSNK